MKDTIVMHFLRKTSLDGWLLKLKQRIRLLLELRRYDNFSIAEYFRKQGAQIGENCHIVPRRLGTEPYLVKIGNHVAISEGVILHTHDGGTWVFRDEFPGLRVFGPIIIEDNCLIGVNAQILPNVRIGRDSIVAAGSVVIADVPPDSIVMGVPARRIGARSIYKEKCLKRWAEQRPPDFHPDSRMPQWAASENVDIILAQLKARLLVIFQKQLYDGTKSSDIENSVQ
jgi:acetyltransferase-like isoleucine patch superfamily enzyme